MPVSVISVGEQQEPVGVAPAAPSVRLIRIESAVPKQKPGVRVMGFEDPGFVDTSSGFISNLTDGGGLQGFSRNIKTAAETGALGSAARMIAGNPTTAQIEEQKRRYGMGGVSDEDLINAEANLAFEQGDDVELAEAEAKLSAIKQAESQPIGVGDIARGIKQDPGGAVAQVLLGLAGDPELLAIPLGATRAAASVAKSAGTVGRSLAGATGAAATSAAIEAPVSALIQLDKEGRISTSELARDVGIAAGISAPIGAIVGPVAARGIGRIARTKQDTGPALNSVIDADKFTMPEPRPTIDAGIDKVRSGDRKSVFVSDRSALPQEIDGLKIVQTGDGGAHVTTSENVKSIAMMEAQGRRDEILDYLQSKEEALSAGDEVVATHIDESGRVIADEVVSRGRAKEAIDTSSERFGSSGVGLRTAEDAVFTRAAQNLEEAGATAGAQFVPVKLTIGDKLSRYANDITDKTTFELLRDSGEFLTGKSITPIRRVGKRNTYFNKIADMLEPDETGKRVAKPVYHESVSMNTGKFISRLMDVLNPITRKIMFGGIPRAVEREITRGLRGIEKPQSLMADQVVKQLRGYLDDVRQFVVDSGVSAGEVKDYFPRVYNKRLISKESIGGELEKVFVKYGIDGEAANQIRLNIINNEGIFSPADTVRKVSLDDAGNVVDVKTFKAPLKGKKNPNLERGRTLDFIPDAELEPFLENDLFRVLSSYTQSAMNRAEWVKRFGVGGGKLTNLVRKGIEEGRLSGRLPKQAEIDRVYNIADALQNNYNQIKSQSFRKANNFNLSYQLIRTLPLATISSLSEIMTPFIRGNTLSYAKGLAKSIPHISRSAARMVFKGVKKADATKAIEEIGIGLDGALSQYLERLFGGVSNRATEGFFKLTGLQQWTRFNRVIANETGKAMIVGHLKNLSKGGLGKFRDNKMRRQLGLLGVPVDDGVQWIRNGAKETDDFFDTVKNGGLRFTNDVIMNPRVTNRPLWMSDPHFRFLAQLKGFQTVFNNTFLKRSARELFEEGLVNSLEEGARMAIGGALMTTVAVYGNALRERINYGPGGNPRFKKEGNFDTIFRGVERTGLFGPGQYWYDSSQANKFGSSGVQQILGPTVTQANEIVEGIENARKGKPKKLANEIVNAIPFANVHKPTRKKIVEAIAGSE